VSTVYRLPEEPDPFPTPWKINEDGYIVDANGVGVLLGSASRYRQAQERIVKAVNEEDW
jgi:hypothetical protein